MSSEKSTSPEVASVQNERSLVVQVLAERQAARVDRAALPSRDVSLRMSQPAWPARRGNVRCEMCQMYSSRWPDARLKSSNAALAVLKLGSCAWVNSLPQPPLVSSELHVRMGFNRD